MTDSDRSLRARAVSGGFTALKWGLAIGAFWYVGRQVAWRETLAQLETVGAGVAAIVLLVTALEFVSRFSMWVALTGPDDRVSFATAARVDLVIKFVNHVVPSKASGHSIAPLVLRHFTGRDWTEVASLAGLNTGLYATMYGVVATIGVATVAPRVPRGVALVILLSTGIYLAAGVVIMTAGWRLDAAGAFARRIGGALGTLPLVGDRLAGVSDALPSFTAESATVFRTRSSSPSVVVPYALGWLGTLAVVPGIRVAVLLSALGDGFSPVLLLPVVLVTAYSVTVLPITPGGVGVAEASATLVLTSLGIAEGTAATVILLDRAFGVYLPALLGWVPTARVDLGQLVSEARAEADGD